MQDNTQLYMDFPIWGIGLIVLIGSLFLYNSLVRLFALYDAISADAFFKNPVVKRRFAEYRDAFSDRDLILTTLPAIVLISILLPFGVFPEAQLLFGSLGSLQYPITYAVYILSFIFTAINSRYETRRHWRAIYESHDTEIVRRRIIFLLKGVLIAVIYPFAVPLSPLLAVIGINLFSVLVALLGLFSTVGLGIATTLVIILLLLMPRIRALSARRKFTKRLSSVAERAGYEILDMHKEKGFAPGYAGAISFSLKYNDRRYTCRLIPIEHRGRPIYFTDARNAYFLLKIGTKKHFVSMTKHFEYAPNGDGKSIVILAPEPKYVFASSDGGERRLYTGDAIWQHSVYEPDSFLGSLDRHCLDKVNGMFE